MADIDRRVSLDEPATMRIGPLGSTVHVLRADAGTVAAFAAIDWNRWFSRVRLDPVRGFITLMSPSRLHDELAEIFDDIVDAAASALAGASKNLRTTRLCQPNDPPGTGLEPDCAFYLDERAQAASEVLAGLTPADVCEATERVRLSATRDERSAAVADIVRRRRRAGVRVREEETSYGAATR